jgi:hypothetical protein
MSTISVILALTFVNTFILIKTNLTMSKANDRLTAANKTATSAITALAAKVDSTVDEATIVDTETNASALQALAGTATPTPTPAAS